MYTENCIICSSAAKMWTGHVIMGTRKEKITAGWCKIHAYKSEDMSLMSGAACFGIWKKEFGLKKEL